LNYRETHFAPVMPLWIWFYRHCNLLPSCPMASIGMCPLGGCHAIAISSFLSHDRRRSFWRIVHSAALPPNVNREQATAHAFVFAFESTFCAPAPFLSSLILARKPPVALLYKVQAFGAGYRDMRIFFSPINRLMFCMKPEQTPCCHQLDLHWLPAASRP
jgi:hypothetical protein